MVGWLHDKKSQQIKLCEQYVSNIQLEEISLVLFFLDKENFDKYYKYISKLNFERETKNFLNTVKEYFKEYPETLHIKVEDLLIFFSVKHPVLKRNTVYQDYLSKLGSMDINQEVLKENLNNLLEKYYASEIVFSLTEVLDGNTFGVLDEVRAKIDEFDENKVKMSDDNGHLFVNCTLADLLEEEVRKPGLVWRLDCLNGDIGELRGGTLGHVFARVDTGKTSFLVSEVTHFASQLSDDEVILWFNNEEKGTRVQLRIYQAVLNCSKDQLLTYPEDAERTFRQRGGDKIRIYDRAPISIDDIESVIAGSTKKVRLIVIDQGDKIKFSGDRDMSSVEKLKVLYGRFRELAKVHGCDILTVGQASAQVQGKKWLDTDHMDNSKTGKPGELDYAVGIGRSYENIGTSLDDMRYIHVCKNKMKDGVHGRHEVFLNTATAIYRDRGKAGGEQHAGVLSRSPLSPVALLFQSILGGKSAGDESVHQREAGLSEEGNKIGEGHVGASHEDAQRAA